MARSAAIDKATCAGLLPLISLMPIGQICPIGISEINGKSPAHVALSIAADLAIWQQLREDAEQRVYEA